MRRVRAAALAVRRVASPAAPWLPGLLLAVGLALAAAALARRRRASSASP